MRHGQRGFIYPHGFVRDRVNFGSKPERHDGGGGHRIDHASTIYQDLDDGISDFREGGEDGSAERVVQSLRLR